MTKFFIFPYGETFKQISAIGEFWRKECSDSIQCQCFSKSSWAGDQGEAIVAFPPFFDEMRFINIEEIVFPKKGKALFACRNRTWHDVLRFRGRCRLWMGLLGAAGRAAASSGRSLPWIACPWKCQKRRRKNANLPAGNGKGAGEAAASSAPCAAKSVCRLQASRRPRSSWPFRCRHLRGPGRAWRARAGCGGDARRRCGRWSSRRRQP